MTRVKRGITSRRKHRKLLEAAKGYRGTKSRLVRKAREAVLHAGAYAFHGRKLKKRDFRRLWITRISEATKMEGMSYSEFIHKMSEAKIGLDRKILSTIIATDLNTFKEIVNKVKSA